MLIPCDRLRPAKNNDVKILQDATGDDSLEGNHHPVCHGLLSSTFWFVKTFIPLPKTPTLEWAPCLNQNISGSKARGPFTRFGGSLLLHQPLSGCLRNCSPHPLCERKEVTVVGPFGLLASFDNVTCHQREESRESNPTCFSAEQANSVAGVLVCCSQRMLFPISYLVSQSTPHRQQTPQFLLPRDPELKEISSRGLLSAHGHRYRRSL